MPKAKQKRNLIIAVLVIFLVAVGAGAFTTIYNPADEPTWIDPEWKIEAGLENATVLSEEQLKSATISGTVTFTITNIATHLPDPAVTGVFLAIYNDGRIFDKTYQFNVVTTQREYTYSLDTTLIPNGEYTFSFYHTVQTEGGQFIMSTMSFSFSNGEGVGQPETNWLLIAGISVLIIAVAIWASRR